MVRNGALPCCSFKLQFIDAFSNAIVGAPDRRPYDNIVKWSLNCNLNDCRLDKAKGVLHESNTPFEI